MKRFMVLVMHLDTSEGKYASNLISCTSVGYNDAGEPFFTDFHFKGKDRKFLSIGPWYQIFVVVKADLSHTNGWDLLPLINSNNGNYKIDKQHTDFGITSESIEASGYEIFDDFSEEMI